METDKVRFLSLEWLPKSVVKCDSHYSVKLVQHLHFSPREYLLILNTANIEQTRLSKYLFVCCVAIDKWIVSSEVVDDSSSVSSSVPGLGEPER